MRYLIILLTVVMSILLLAPYFGVDPLGQIFYSNNTEVAPLRNSSGITSSQSRRERITDNEEATTTTESPQNNRRLAEIEDLLEEK